MCASYGFSACAFLWRASATSRRRAVLPNLPCADGRHIAIGSLEPQFFAVSVARLGLEEGALGDPWKPENWPAWRAAIGAAFASRPRDEWTPAFAGSDACVTPVLDLEEAPLHPHNVARGGVGRGAARPAPPQARRKPEIRFVAGSGRRRSAGFRGLNEGRRYCSAADIDLRRSPRRTSATDKRSETALAGREGGGAPRRGQVKV